jgi:hypothetical protein
VRGRGLCSTCWERAKRDGTLYDYPASRRKLAETMTEYELLRLTGETTESAARRLGYSTRTMKRYVLRWRERQSV